MTDEYAPYEFGREEATIYEFAEYLMRRYETVLRALDSEFDSSFEATSEIDRQVASLRAEYERLRGES